MIKLINWGTGRDIGPMTMFGTMVQGISVAKSSMAREETFSMNAGNGHTHYFDSEAKLITALNAVLA